MTSTTSPTYYFNCSPKPNPPLPYNEKAYPSVNFSLVTDDFTLDASALLDTGASNTVIPIQYVKDEFIKFTKRHSLQNITGVGGKNKVIGTYCGSMQLANLSLPNVTVLIVEQMDTPILIGRDVLKHNLVSSSVFDWENKCANFQLHDGNSYEVPFIEKLETAVWTVASHPTSGEPTGNTDYPAWLKDNHGVDLSHLGGNELERASGLLYKFRRLFGDEEDNMGCLKGGVAELHTAGESINIPARRVSPHIADKVQKEIDRMLNMGVIVPCPDNLGWNSPVMPVKKPDGRIRVTIDFKQSLNRRLTRLDPFKQDGVEDILRGVPPRVKYFSSMDLIHGYWQIKIRECDQPKTAFYWKDQNYMFTRLPMGLTSSGNIFSREVARVLGQMIHSDKIFKYLDDLSVMTETFEEHYNALENLFQVLDKAGLRLKAKKCSFFASSIKFLGRIADKDGYRPDPEYVKGVDAVSAPTNEKELKNLQGKLVWIQNWIGTRMHEEVSAGSFSNIMQPFFECGRHKPFVWTKEADRALDRVKKKLKTQPYISYCDPDKPFILQTDASNLDVSGVLMQKYGGKYHVVGNFSKSLDKTQRKWSTIERECYAILLAVRKFSYFLRWQPFCLHTDHKPLVYLDRTNIKNAKIQGWQEELSNYMFTVEHVKGVDNVMADWLSRPSPNRAEKEEHEESELCGKFYRINGSDLQVYIPSLCKKLVELPDGKTPVQMELTPDYTCEVNAMVNFATIYSQESAPDEVEITQFLGLSDAQLTDSSVLSFILALEKRKEETDQLDVKLKCPDDFAKSLLKSSEKLSVDKATRLLMIDISGVKKIVIPPSFILTVVKTAHSVAHVGVERTLESLSSFWWPKKEMDVKAFVSSCEACLRRKGRYGNLHPPAGSILKGTTPFEVIYIDYINVPTCRGFKYCMTLQDSLTRWIEVFPSKTNTAIDTAKFLAKFVVKWGITPKIISSDRGTHFANEVMTRFCENLKIKQNLHCAWRPQSSGSIERMHRTLKNSLFCAAWESKNQWLDNLDIVVSILNSLKNRSTKCSPFYALHGYEWSHPGMPVVSSWSVKPGENIGFTLCERLEKCHRAIIQMSQAADERRVLEANSRYEVEPLATGDQVMIFRPVSAEAKETNMPNIGPYTVVQANELTAKLRNNDNGVEDYVSRHHIKKIKPKPAFAYDDEDELLIDECVPSGGGDTAEVPIKTENSSMLKSSEYQPITLDAAAMKRKFKQWADAKTKPRVKRKKDSHNMSSSSTASGSGARRGERPTKMSRLEPPISAADPSRNTQVRKSTRQTKQTKPLQVDGHKKTYK